MRAVSSQSQALTSPVQTIAVTGGKGGVGKSTVAVNLACELAALGRRTLLLDGDLGLANADVMLGLTPTHTLADVLAGERALDEIVVPTPYRFQLVPSASGLARMASLSEIEHLGIVKAFAGLGSNFDSLVIDTAAGISTEVLRFAHASQHVLVVVCDEPTSLTDAYGLIKVLLREHGVRRFQVLANMVRGPGEGRRLFATLEKVTSRFLDVILEYTGEIPLDPQVRLSIREQRPISFSRPASPAAAALKQLGAHADKWPVPSGPRGHIEFFAERLLRRPPVRLELVR